MATISVIVPVYKVEPYLRRCIDSILAQTYSDFELILVDDGSPDNCGNICDEYAAKDNRIHVIHQENGGVSAARNTGINWAYNCSNSSYLAFVDADDRIEPGYLDLLLSGISPGVRISCSEATIVYNRYSITPRKRPQKWRQITPEEYWTNNTTWFTCVPWGKLFDKVLFKEIRFPSYRIAEDQFAVSQVLFSQQLISYIAVSRYNYRVQDNSLTHASWDKRMLDAIIVAERIYRYFDKQNFPHAASYMHGRWIAELAIAINHLKGIDNSLSASFEKTIDENISKHEHSFWEIRDFHRARGCRYFTLKWIIGMVRDFLVNGKQSWLAQDAVPLVTDYVFRKLRN